MKFIVHIHQEFEIPGKGMLKFGMSQEAARDVLSEQYENLYPGDTQDDLYNSLHLRLSYYKSRGLNY
jgi:hypothetical protein